MCLWFDTTARELKSESIFSCVSIFYFIFSASLFALGSGCVCVCVCNVYCVKQEDPPQYTNSNKYQNTLLYPFTCPVYRQVRVQVFVMRACMRIRHVSSVYTFVHVIIIIGAISFYPPPDDTSDLSIPICCEQYVLLLLDCWLLAYKVEYDN